MKCIEDEIPFDIPEKWAWCRVHSFISFTGGAQPPKSTFEYESSDNNIRLIQIRDYKTDAHMTYIPKELARRFCDETDVMIGRYGPPLFQILRGLKGAYNVALMKAETSNQVMSKEYLFYLLQDSELLRTLESVADRTCGQDGINMYVLNNYLLPIPPIELQQRIILYLDTTVHQVDSLSGDIESLHSLIELSKAKVLDLAIRGKLVPQDINDEPASAILDRIRAEKENLIKKGKLKCNKKESVIYKGDDNSYFEKYNTSGTVIDITADIPYDLPQKWQWCRLKEIVQIINGDRGANYPAKNKLHDSGIPFVSASNIDDGIVSNESGMKYLSQDQYELLRAGLLQCNDIVYCIRGSLGKCGIFPYELGAIASSLVIVRPFVKTSSIINYLMIYLNSALSFSEIKKYDNGTAQPNLAAKDFENFLIPLPPLNMINMIVEKYNQLIGEVSLIAESL